MLERRSALASVSPIKTSNVSLEEAPDFSLLQVTKPDKQAVAILGQLPRKIGEAKTSSSRTVMKTGPDQYWIVGPPADGLAQDIYGYAVLTPLSSSRTRIALSGPGARMVLAKSAAIDFDSAVFGPGQFVMTGIHHTPVLINCVGQDSFHLYALRTFALDLWEWLADHAG